VKFLKFDFGKKMNSARVRVFVSERLKHFLWCDGFYL
jgi:hypothetical protein